MDAKMIAERASEAADRELDLYCISVMAKHEQVYRLPITISDVARVSILDQLGLYNGEELSV